MSIENRRERQPLSEDELERVGGGEIFFNDDPNLDSDPNARRWEVIGDDGSCIKRFWTKDEAIDYAIGHSYSFTKLSRSELERLRAAHS